MNEPCIRMCGTAAFAGNLSVSKDSIRFEPLNERLRAIDGSSWREDILEITGVQFLGSKSRVLIWSNGTAQRFVGPGARKIASFLLEQLDNLKAPSARQEQPEKTVKKVRRLSASAMAQTLAQWGPIIGRKRKEQGILASQGSYTIDDGDSIEGILILTDYRVVLVPKAGLRSTLPPWHSRILGIRPDNTLRLNESPIQFSMTGHFVSFVPSEGDDMAREFWETQGSLAETRLPMGFHSKAPSHLLGASPRVTLRFDRGFYVRDQPGLVLDLRDGIGLTLASPPTPPPKNGCPVQVDIYTPMGVHWFQSKIKRTAIAPRGVIIDGKEAWNMVVVEVPKAIHLMERRHFTRIDVDRHPVELSEFEPGDSSQPSGTKYYGVLLNLSDSGAMLRMKRSLPVDQRFSLYWRTPSGGIELEGRCIRSQQEPGDEFLWRCAVELVEKDDLTVITGVFRAV